MISIDELYPGPWGVDLWQMSAQEKMGCMYAINKLPVKNIAIEIGSYKGGFLKYLASKFDTVYSLDIDFQYINRLQYKNVIFIEGDSKETLPKLVEHLNRRNKEVNFIMIDGDHTYDTVIQDINNSLNLNVLGDMIIMCHDSWYTPSRDAISNANWNMNSHVHKVEKDFVCGDTIWSPSEGKNLYIGGLSISLLSPQEREGDLVIGQTHDYMYVTVTNLLNRAGKKRKRS